MLNVFAIRNPYNMYKWYNNIILQLKIIYFCNSNINSPSIKSKKCLCSTKIDLIRIEFKQSSSLYLNSQQLQNLLQHDHDDFNLHTSKLIDYLVLNLVGQNDRQRI